jgi:hypothetical protein
MLAHDHLPDHHPRLAGTRDGGSEIGQSDAVEKKGTMPVRCQWLVAAAVVVVTTFAPAAAQSPVAIVEEIEAPAAGVEFMDYLFPGQVIRLGLNGRIVVSYFDSCWRESVLAGTVTIGRDQSQVSEGRIDRAKYLCAGGKMQLSGEQAKHSGGMTFRAPVRKGTEKQAQPEPQLVHGSAPVFDLQHPGTLTIERIDAPGEKFEQAIAAEHLLRGSFFDLARVDRSLAQGGLYRARHGGRLIVFRIAPDAKPGAGPVAGRLVRFPKG